VLKEAAAGPAHLAELVHAFAAIEPQLNWTKRTSEDPAHRSFNEGHANARIFGDGGIEERDDVQVGVTVLAPHVRYIDHDHPPEEVYVALSEGEWWNADMDWTEPGPGGLIYNPPGILHAMRSGAKPFLAMWLLPLD
jgi:quercetin dioxygenase-like cupin family protein